MSVLPTQLADGMLAVATHNLVKCHGTRTALNGVNLQVPQGAIYVLVGPNGAGKSTLLKTLLDLVRPTAGEVEIFGLFSPRRGPEIRAQIGYVPEHHNWGYRWMRAGRLFEHHAAYYPSWDQGYARQLAGRFGVGLDRPLGKFSKGQARCVHLILALAHRPRLLVLDEPMDGLDPVMRDEAMGALVEHSAESGTTILFSTHQVHEVQRLADHLGLMNDGQLIVQVRCDILARNFRHYAVVAPEGWAGSPILEGAIFRRDGLGREVHCGIWGDEADVIAALAQSGATVHAVKPLSLEEASLALLTAKEIL